MKTSNLTPKDMVTRWHVVDAAGQTVGRVAARIALVLTGKHTPKWTPHLDFGDHVVVVNAEKIKLSGNKWRDKVYYHHTAYVGGIKAARAEEVLAKHPTRIIESAVKGMLPKSKLGRKMFKKLKVYTGPDHPHATQKPETLVIKTRKSTGE